MWMDGYLAATLGRIYMDIRRRFFFFGRIQKRYTLSTWKKKEKKSSSKAIREGNAAGHDGDAVADAFFIRVRQENRSDPFQSEELYGLEADPILPSRTHFLTFPTLSPVQILTADLDETEQ